MNEEVPPLGDFRIIKMDGMFHVVFRPDADPEWFRIVASFFTYERAYYYCDTERVLTFEMESCTADEQKAGLRLPPVGIDTDRAQRDADIPGMIRDIYQISEQVQPLPKDECIDQPENTISLGEANFESPEDYSRRLCERQIAEEADRQTRSPGPPAAPENDTEFEVRLTEKQESVFRFFVSHANAQKLVNASLKQIAKESGVPQGSMAFLLESLERKRLIEVVERGSPSSSGVFRIISPFGCGRGFERNEA